MQLGGDACGVYCIVFQEQGVHIMENTKINC